MSLSLHRPDRTRKTLRSLIKKKKCLELILNTEVVDLVNNQNMVIIIEYLCLITCLKRYRKRHTDRNKVLLIVQINFHYPGIAESKRRNSDEHQLSSNSCESHLSGSTTGSHW